MQNGKEQNNGQGRWMRLPAAAAYAGGVSTKTIRRLIEAGKLAKHQPSGRAILIDRHELDALIKAS